MKKFILFYFILYLQDLNWNMHDLYKDTPVTRKYLHRNLSINFPAHIVVSATLMENTRMWPFPSLQNIPQTIVNCLVKHSLWNYTGKSLTQ